MTRFQAIQLLNCSYAELATKLEISTAAVARWGDSDIPDFREYQIRDLAAGRTPAGLSKSKLTLDQSSKNNNVQIQG